MFTWKSVTAVCHVTLFLKAPFFNFSLRSSAFYWSTTSSGASVNIRWVTVSASTLTEDQAADSVLYVPIRKCSFAVVMLCKASLVHSSYCCLLWEEGNIYWYLIFKWELGKLLTSLLKSLCWNVELLEKGCTWGTMVSRGSMLLMIQLPKFQEIGASHQTHAFRQHRHGSDAG